MMFLLVIAMGSSLLHCMQYGRLFKSKRFETRIKVVSSHPSGHGHVEARCPRGKKTYQWLTTLL